LYRIEAIIDGLINKDFATKEEILTWIGKVICKNVEIKEFKYG